MPGCGYRPGLYRYGRRCGGCMGGPTETLGRVAPPTRSSSDLTLRKALPHSPSLASRSLASPLLRSLSGRRRSSSWSGSVPECGSRSASADSGSAVVGRFLLGLSS